MSADDFPPWRELEEEEEIDDEALPPHKRAGWLELQYERADDQRKAQREQELLQSNEANEWAISTGAKA